MSKRRPISGEEFRRRAEAKAAAPAGGEGPPADPAPPPAEHRPFPVECLPQPMREYVSAGALSLGCDVSYIAPLCLTAAATAIGATRRILIKDGFVEPAILWTGIIGRSGTLKSPAFRVGTHHLGRRQFEFLAQHDKDVAAWEDECAERAAADKAARLPDKPAARRVLTNDTTNESLISILAENPRGVGVYRSELAGWLGGFGKYSKANDYQTWLEIYDGGSSLVDRKGGDRRTARIAAAAVSITGGLQPEILLRSFTPEYLEAGLGARFLFAWPPERPQVWTDAEIPAGVNQDWEDLLDALLELQFREQTDAGPVPHLHRLTAAARRRYVEWFNSWHRRISATKNPFLRSAFAKGLGHAARLALVCHVCRSSWSYLDQPGHREVEVGVQEIEAGIGLTEWFGNEAVRIYGEEHVDTSLVDWIRARGGKVCARDLVTYRKPTSADQAVQQLAELVAAKKGQWAKDGKKRHVFELFE